MYSELFCHNQGIVIPDKKQVTNAFLTSIRNLCFKYFFEYEACSYALNNNCPMAKLGWRQYRVFYLF